MRSNRIKNGEAFRWQPSVGRLCVFFMTGIAIAGCSSTKYAGPGTVQDFAAARTECYSTLKASANDEPTVNCGAWTACLMSKGYVLDKNGSFDVDALGMKISCTE